MVELGLFLAILFFIINLDLDTLYELNHFYDDTKKVGG